MAGLRARLREWWRRNYMENGFGVLVPGFRRLMEKDLRDLLETRRGLRFIRALPEGWYVGVVHGQFYAAPDPEALNEAMTREYELVGWPREHRVSPTRARPRKPSRRQSNDGPA